MTNYILNAGAPKFLNEMYNYYNTEIRDLYQNEYGYLFNLYKGDQIIVIETNCPYIYNSDGYQSEANEYKTIIKETWLDINSDTITKEYIGEGVIL